MQECKATLFNIFINNKIYKEQIKEQKYEQPPIFHIYYNHNKMKSAKSWKNHLENERKQEINKEKRPYLPLNFEVVFTSIFWKRKQKTYKTKRNREKKLKTIDL